MPALPDNGATTRARARCAGVCDGGGIFVPGPPWMHTGISGRTLDAQGHHQDVG